MKSGDVVARAKVALAYEDGYPVSTCGIHTGRASNRCLLPAEHEGQHDDNPPPFTFPESLAVELVAEVEKLRGAMETIRVIADHSLDEPSLAVRRLGGHRLQDILAVIERTTKEADNGS